MNITGTEIHSDYVTELVIPSFIMVTYSESLQVTAIDDWAFYNNAVSSGGGKHYKNLKSVSLPQTLMEIGRGAFCQTPIESIDIPDGVYHVGEDAFRGCHSLENVSLPSSLTSINDGVFHYCRSLKSVAIPEGVTSIGEEAFSGCESLASVSLPSTLTSIGDDAFSVCESLESVSLPSTLTSIGDYAFSGCESLESVAIPEGVTSIGLDAFEGCTSLESMTLPAIEGLDIGYICGYAPLLPLRDLAVTPGSGSIAEFAFCDCRSLANVVIQDGVISIGDGAFEGCTSLESVTLPSTLASIGGYAFSGCESLESVAIPEGVTSIGERAFENCDSLKSVAIPESVTSIGEDAFRECESLYSVSLPSTLTSIGDEAFEGLPYGSVVYAPTREVCEMAESVVDPERTTVVCRVHRIWGESASETSAAISAMAFAGGSSSDDERWVVIARDDDFADAMSATGLAGALECPIILTDRCGLSEAASAEIERLGAISAYVIGGPGAMPGDFESELAAIGCEVEGRVYGDAAWDTSVACAERIAQHGGNASDSIVAMSLNFQDALSISSFAYRYKVPIYLQTQAGDRPLPDGAVSMIAKASGRIYVPGGPGAVKSSTVEDVFGSDRVVRIYGEDGYDTSNQIARYMVDNSLLTADVVAVACGAQAARGTDALSGAALAGRAGGVVLLANANEAMEGAHMEAIEGSDSQGDPAFLAAVADDARQVYVLGGAYVMPESLVDRVASLLKL